MNNQSFKYHIGLKRDTFFFNKKNEKKSQYMSPKRDIKEFDASAGKTEKSVYLRKDSSD